VFKVIRRGTHLQGFGGETSGKERVGRTSCRGEGNFRVVL